MYKRYERQLETAISERFELQYPYPDEVKWADNVLLVTEARDLMHGVKGWSETYQTIEPLEEHIEAWTPEIAELKFLGRYYSLIGG